MSWLLRREPFALNKIKVSDTTWDASLIRNSFRLWQGLLEIIVHQIPLKSEIFGEESLDNCQIRKRLIVKRPFWKESGLAALERNSFLFRKLVAMGYDRVSVNIEVCIPKHAL